MISLAKSLDHSSSAAALVGPKALSPAWLKSSTIPAARASSGPIKVQATSLVFAKSINLECSEIEIFTNSKPSRVIPSFPGATKTFSTSFDSSNFLAIACSRPPEPTTSSFIPQPLLRIIYQHYIKKVRFNLVSVSILSQKRKETVFFPFIFLMSKMSHACKDHGQAIFVCRFDRFLVTDRATGLDDGLNSCFGDFFHVIRKWEEGI
ncbi:Uncharacterised protein [Streptococcus pneumoniae]|nr:Uncharacterised protein [Streptococcus pneumoniae]CAG5948889.1 Uncharacterised protein [Streptococcus pneumoniae]CAG6265463.1 Uncharacterised protein [Streptococcus pneumoniae]